MSSDHQEVEAVFPQEFQQCICRVESPQEHEIYPDRIAAGLVQVGLSLLANLSLFLAGPAFVIRRLNGFVRLLFKGFDNVRQGEPRPALPTKRKSEFYHTIREFAEVRRYQDVSVVHRLYSVNDRANLNSNVF